MSADGGYVALKSTVKIVPGAATGSTSFTAYRVPLNGSAPSVLVPSSAVASTLSYPIAMSSSASVLVTDSASHLWQIKP